MEGKKCYLICLRKEKYKNACVESAVDCCTEMNDKYPCINGKTDEIIINLEYETKEKE